MAVALIVGMVLGFIVGMVISNIMNDKERVALYVQGKAYENTLLVISKQRFRTISEKDPQRQTLTGMAAMGAIAQRTLEDYGHTAQHDGDMQKILAEEWWERVTGLNAKGKPGRFKGRPPTRTTKRFKFGWVDHYLDRSDDQ